MAQVGKQVLVEALVHHAAIEALYEVVLHRFPRCDVVPFDPALLLPFQDRVRSKLGAVVRDNHARVAPHFGNPA